MSVRQATGRMTHGRRWEQIVLPLGLIVLGLALIATMQHLIGVLLVLVGMLSARRVLRPRRRRIGRGGPAGPPSR
jgi:hypothetical protein